MPNLMETYLEKRERIRPDHANNFEMAHGGEIAKWMDEAGVMSAMRFSGETCVTAEMDNIDFEKPVPLDDILLVESFVFDAGETSVDVRLRAYREDPRTTERELTAESYFTFVAVDDEGDPTDVPELTVESDEGRKRRDEALDGWEEE